MYCATHPNEQTSLSCGRCEKAICPKCLVHAPVGIRCRECAPAQPSRARRGISVFAGVIIVVVIIAIAGSLATGGNSTNDYPNYQDYVDEFAKFSGAVTADQVIDPWLPENPAHAASPGRRFVAIEVTIANAENAELDHYVTAYNFKLTDEESFAYEATYAGAKPLLPEEFELRPGEKTRGWVTFEIDESNEIKSLEYVSVDVPLPQPASVGR